MYNKKKSKRFRILFSALNVMLWLFLGIAVGLLLLAYIQGGYSYMILAFASFFVCFITHELLCDVQQMQCRIEENEAAHLAFREACESLVLPLVEPLQRRVLKL